MLKVHKGNSAPGIAYFKNIRCIYHRAGWHYWDGGRVVSFGGDAGNNYDNILISNILIEDPHPSLPAFSFTMNNNDSTLQPASFNNAVIEKVIQINGGTPNAWGDDTFGAPQNQMFGSDSAGMFSNIVFKNCYHDGQWLGSFQDGQFLTNNFIQNIPFVLDDTLSLSAPAYMGSVNTSLANLPPMPVILQGDSVSFCAGDSVMLVSSAANNNLWSMGDTSQSIYAAAADFYTVSVSNGVCTITSDSTQLFEFNLAGYSLQPDSITAFEMDTVQFIMSNAPAGALLQWQVNNGSGFQNINDGGQYIGANNDTLAIINLSVALNNNQEVRCVITYGPCLETTAISSLFVNGVTGLQEAETSAGITFFPNPASDQILVNVKNGYRISDTTGQLIKASNLSSSQINIADLATGLYFLQIGNSKVKLIKVE